MCFGRGRELPSPADIKTEEANYVSFTISGQQTNKQDIFICDVIMSPDPFTGRSSRGKRDQGGTWNLRRVACEACAVSSGLAFEMEKEILEYS